MWNPDIVHEYVALLVTHKQFGRAIEAKKQFINNLKKLG
jgi:hypothetical protein